MLSKLCLTEKPKLYLDGLIGKKIKVRAGEPINIQIPLSGAPIPVVEWTKNTVKLPETNRISVSFVQGRQFSSNKIPYYCIITVSLKC